MDDLRQLCKPAPIALVPGPELLEDVPVLTNISYRRACDLLKARFDIRLDRLRYSCVTPVQVSVLLAL